MQGEIDRLQDEVDNEKKELKECGKQLNSAAEQLADVKSQLAESQEENVNLLKTVKVSMCSLSLMQVMVTKKAFTSTPTFIPFLFSHSLTLLLLVIQLPLLFTFLPPPNPISHFHSYSYSYSYLYSYSAGKSFPIASHPYWVSQRPRKLQLGKVGPVKNFLTHYLVLSPGLLCVDIVVLGLLLCLYIHMFNVL